MFVKVMYLKDNGYYSGGGYAYSTKLPLVQGDLVIAPTAKNPRQRALVKEINLPKPTFVCREITEYDPEAGIPAVQPL